jgi:hypothetical protein
MILSEDVVLPGGNSLVNEGQVLNDRLIATLHKRGIAHIDIMTEEDESPEHEQSAGGAAPSPDAGGHATTSQEAADDAQTGAADEEEHGTSGQAASQEPVMPYITVSVAQDRMSATVSVSPQQDGANKDITSEDIMNALNDNDVVYGIHEDVVMKAVSQYNESKRSITMDGVAKGRKPTPGVQGALHITAVSGQQEQEGYITTKSDYEVAREAHAYYELADAGIRAERIEKGSCVARRDQDTPPVEGLTVTGDEVTTDTIHKKPVQTDATITVSEDETEYTAATTGVLYFFSDSLGIIPLEFDGAYEIQLSDDRMEAYVIVRSPGPGGSYPTRNALQQALQQANVVQGLLQDKIDTLAEEVMDTHIPDEPVLVAQGKAPQNGEDGYIKYFFNTQSSLKPKQKEDGSVDLKELNVIQSVKKGDKLATVVPPTEGSEGIDVTGNKLPFTEGKPAQLPQGKNTGQSPDEEGVLIATEDGNVRLNNALVEVVEGFSVSGDVDYSIGNIDYKHSVEVKGDIKAGFSVKCGGNLDVGGVIEDAVVETGGDIVCKQGFVGQGKGVVSARGSVNLLFAKNQTIISRTNVTIAKEALNCAIKARRSVEVLGNPISIVGGEVLARDEIHVYTAGNQSQTATRLEVGIDFSMVEERDNTEKQINEIQEDINKLQEPLKKYSRLLKIKKQLPAKDVEMVRKIKTSLQRYHSKIQALQERKKHIEEKMFNVHNACIRIDHAAMPGVVFKIGEHHHVVKEEVVGPKTVRLVKQKIKVV